MKTSETTKEICPAMAAMQASMKKAAKDSTNPHFKSRYSDLSSVWDAAADSLADNGLYVTQDLCNHEKGVEVTTRVTHKSGEWLEFGPMMVPVVDPKPHAYGSAATYARRYSLSAALSIISDDDDGNGAQFISVDKVEILHLLLNTCDDRLKRWFWNLIQAEYKAKSLDTIPAGCYLMAKAKLLDAKKIADEQDKKVASG